MFLPTGNCKVLALTTMGTIGKQDRKWAWNTGCYKQHLMSPNWKVIRSISFLMAPWTDTKVKKTKVRRRNSFREVLPGLNMTSEKLLNM